MQVVHRTTRGAQQHVAGLLGTRVASAAAMCARALASKPFLGGGSARTSGLAVPWSQGQPVKQSRGLTTARVTVEEGPADGASRVVIVGGGFGGLYTAVRLSSLFWPRGKRPQITLVDQSERFVFKPLLYELVNGSATENEVAPHFMQLLAPYPVRFIEAKVLGAEPSGLLRDGGSAGGGTVELEGGQTLEYDWLILALGAQVDTKGVPGVAKHAVSFNALEDAIKVRDALDVIEVQAQLAPGTRREVVVVGAGYAGVELACVVAERVRDKGLSNVVGVRVITPGSGILDKDAAPGQRQAAQEVMDQLGVVVETGVRVQSVEGASGEGALPSAARVHVTPRTLPSPGVDAGEEIVAPPRTIDADLVLWTAGSRPATREARKRFPFPTDTKGSVRTDATLRVLSHSRVFALGDVCVTDSGYVQPPAGSPGAEERGHQTPPSDPGTSFPATAQVAFQQADYVAWNVWAAMARRPLLPFRYQHLGSMMSLGTFNAAVELPLPVPEALQAGIQSTPVGPLLSRLGIKVAQPPPGQTAGVTIEGPLAALLRRAAYLYRQPTSEQRVNVVSDWVAQAGTVAGAALGYLQRNVNTPHAGEGPSGGAGSAEAGVGTAAGSTSSNTP